jgi:uncharacterized membrane protein
MQCPSCHNEVPSAAFCNLCGAPLSAATPPPAASFPAPPATASSGLSPNAAAAISYVTIIPAILFLILEPYNKMPLVRFHSFQSIALAVCWFALWVVIAVAAMMLAMIPGVRVLLVLVPFLYPLLGLAFFVVWLITILKASKGEWFKLPIIGDFAMKQSQS